MPDVIVRGIATALAVRLAGIEEYRMEKLTGALPKKIAENILNTKIVTYRLFDPGTTRRRSYLAVRWDLGTLGIQRQNAISLESEYRN